MLSLSHFPDAFSDESLLPLPLPRMVIPTPVWMSVWYALRQCSQNVDVNGPHHRCFELIVSSSFNQPMAVERGRSYELVGSMVGAVYVHVLRTLP